MKPYHRDNACTIYNGDCRSVMAQMPEQSINCCVTSPPYWGLRDYGHDGQLRLEATPEEYVANMVDVFREVRRVLRDDGTLWLNLGDSYAATQRSAGASMKSTLATRPTAEKTAAQRDRGARPARIPSGLKPKDLVGIPWRVAFALQADGWYLRQDIIWHKPNPMPESVQDRCTKAHEYIFLLTKSARYWYDADAIKEPLSDATLADGRTTRGTRGTKGEYAAADGNCGFDLSGRNKRSVWTVATQPYKGAHFAVFPPDLIRPCILAGCPKGGTVLDCFGGSGTTAEVAKSRGRRCISVELNEDYIPLQRRRIAQDMLAF